MYTEIWIEVSSICDVLLTGVAIIFVDSLCILRNLNPYIQKEIKKRFNIPSYQKSALLYSLNIIGYMLSVNRLPQMEKYSNKTTGNMHSR